MKLAPPIVAQAGEQVKFRKIQPLSAHNPIGKPKQEKQGRKRQDADETDDHGSGRVRFGRCGLLVGNLWRFVGV